MQQEYDLVISGGGMAGLALAAGLASSPIKIALLEAATQPPSWQANEFNNRVSALSENSRQLLERLKAWPLMEKLRVNPYQGMQVWDGQGSASLSFSASQAGVNNLGYLVENAVTQLALLEIVQHQANLTVYAGSSLKQLSAPLNNQGLRQLTLQDGRQILSKLLVGADGAHSKVRELGQFATREWNYGHQALVTTVRTSQANRNTAWQVFNREGILAFLPLNLDGDKHWCSIVWSTNPENAQELLLLDAAAFNQRLGAAFEERLGKIEFSQARQAITLRQRHAVNYVQAGIALMADAAHTIHPLAGQGINLGFADVQALTKHLQQGIATQQHLGSLSFLQAYQSQRQPANLRMMLAMESLKRLFAQHSLPVLLARNLGMRFVEQQNWLKNKLIAQALGV